jgi:hypothetical protein
VFIYVDEMGITQMLMLVIFREGTVRWNITGDAMQSDIKRQREWVGDFYG